MRKREELYLSNTNSSDGEKVICKRIGKRSWTPLGWAKFCDQHGRPNDGIDTDEKLNAFMVGVR